MVVGGPQTLVSTSLTELLVVLSKLDMVLVLTTLMVLLLVVAVPDMAPVSMVVMPRVVAEGITPPGREGEVEGMVERLGSG